MLLIDYHYRFNNLVVLIAEIWKQRRRWTARDGVELEEEEEEEKGHKLRRCHGAKKKKKWVQWKDEGWKVNDNEPVDTERNSQTKTFDGGNGKRNSHPFLSIFCRCSPEQIILHFFFQKSSKSSNLIFLGEKLLKLQISDQNTVVVIYVS